MTGTQPETMDWALWFYWIMATTLGWLAGSFFFSAIPVIVSGAAIAALQWATLYQRIHKAWRWAVYSTIGWLIGYVLFVFLMHSNTGILLGSVLGGTTGIAQWLLLRKEVDWAGWWIVVSILAWTTGLAVLPGMLTSGALPGAMTGLALVILFRFSQQITHNKD